VPEPFSPTVHRRRLAAELRRLRERARLTGEQVAVRVGWSTSKVSRIENAHTAPRPAEIEKLLAVYNVDAEVAEKLLELAKEGASRGWWETYSHTLPPEYASLIGMEAEAQSAWSWAPLIVPGLLQTADYAREVTNGYLEWITPMPPNETRRRVETRLARQQVLTRDNPLRLSAVFDQSVLQRRFGSKAVMHSQIKYLQDVSERENISLRILPLDGPHPIGTGPFVLLQFVELLDTIYQDVVYLEHLIGGQYIDDEDEVYRYRRSFARLSELALSETRTRQVLEIALDAWK
jgi:transcriptional regulator with XRE-family HTH domain